MRKSCCLVVVISTCAVLASTAQASSVRLFFSYVGTHGGTSTGEALSPGLDSDPAFFEAARVWLWAMPIGGGTTIDGLDFRVVVDGELNINRYEFWNYEIPIIELPRWEHDGFPGSGGDQGQATDDLVFRTETGIGVTNGPWSGFDLHYDGTTNATVLGYLEIGGSYGHVNILFNEGSIAAPNVYERTYLGLDDEVGNSGNGPYSNGIRAGRSEAIFVIPEPASLLIFALGAIAIRRR